MTTMQYSICYCKQTVLTSMHVFGAST